MNTDALQRAYEGLIAAANVVGTSSHLAPSDDAEVSWRLCHIALSDEILTSAAQATLKGLPAIVNNRRAMDKDLIASLTNRTTHGERVKAVRRNGAAFVECIAQLSESQGATAVRLIMHDRNGALVSNAMISWCELVKLRVDRHLPAHTAKLTALAV
ncbi:hypothetical protein FE249_17730 [Acidiphilium multivorum]|uniref:hypothetical protein n=1 Tax=Acidiphilium multivorum TaxID=62140 RepID=UPI001F4C42A3|nr:hypothetical protein [Acidiphilium multivorum]UNC15928.1 hypothetical protein FE249_17730 [Acidiphilium multivorum]